jgi:hypothetical protein
MSVVGFKLTLTDSVSPACNSSSRVEAAAAAAAAEAQLVEHSQTVHHVFCGL